jgi:hypothetical protein
MCAHEDGQVWTGSAREKEGAYVNSMANDISSNIFTSSGFFLTGPDLFRKMNLPTSQNCQFENMIHRFCI